MSVLLFPCTNCWVKTYGLVLVDKVPSHAADINTQSQAALSAISAAIQAYEGIVSKRSMRFGRREAVVAA
jgi:hypothetical protein